MGGDPDRLVDDHEVGIVVDDPHPLDPGRSDRCLRAWELNLQPGTRGDPFGLRRRCTVEADLAVLDEFGGLRPGQAEQAGEGSVEPLSLQSVGYCEAPTVSGRRRRAHSVVPIGLPSTGFALDRLCRSTGWPSADLRGLESTVPSHRLPSRARMMIITAAVSIERRRR